MSFDPSLARAVPAVDITMAIAIRVNRLIWSPPVRLRPCSELQGESHRRKGNLGACPGGVTQVLVIKRLSFLAAKPDGAGGAPQSQPWPAIWAQGHMPRAVCGGSFRAIPEAFSSNLDRSPGSFLGCPVCSWGEISVAPFSCPQRSVSSALHPVRLDEYP
jgi:hypothetical protein